MEVEPKYNCIRSSLQGSRAALSNLGPFPPVIQPPTPLAGVVGHRYLKCAMKKIQKLSGIVCTLLLVAGCSRSSSSNTRTAEQINAPRANGESFTPLTPTGRD